MNRKYRKTLIAGNWKMNKTPTQTKAFMTELKGLLPKGRWCDIALCVPAVCIPAAVRAMRETRVGHRCRELQCATPPVPIPARSPRICSLMQGANMSSSVTPSAAPWARRMRT